MHLLQRVCLAIAWHGVTGLPRRLVRKVVNAERREEMIREKAIQDARSSYARLARDFEARILQLDLPHLKDFYWYHTVDLGNGLVTPGDYDYREILPNYGFPDDMRGMNVLDVGSATGYFAFEFERRGANVTSVELPSIAHWDIVHTERQKTFDLMRLHPAETIEEISQRLVEGPFQFCHRMLKSKVKRCYSRVYDLTPAKLGADGFDLIFVGDVLGHLFSPLQALDVLAPLCRGKMIISMDVAESLPMPEGLRNPPSMRYVGGNTEDSGRSWWIPDRTCLMQMLDKVGFRSVKVVGETSLVVRRCWLPSHRAIYHATK